MNISSRPLAAPGLTSYRYRGPYGWIMIGATDGADALANAARSTSAPITPDKLQVWAGQEYVDALPRSTRKDSMNHTTTNSSGVAERRIMLYKREGSADKVYQLNLRAGAAPATFDVVFENARRGQPLKVAKSLPGLSLEAATAEFEKQLKAKKKDGYTEQESGQAYTSSEFAGRDSGLRPQLPKPVSEDRLQQLLRDPAWAMQQKANGENRMLHFDGCALRGTNKKGLWVEIPAAWEAQLLRAEGVGPFVICGEQVGDAYFAFDALHVGGEDLRGMEFELRYARLEAVLCRYLLPDLRLLPAYFIPEQKARVLEALRQRNEEGVVFKLRSALHQDGYSDAALKFKFNESSACQVLAVNHQRSVQIGLVDESGAVVPVGNATIPANHAMPQPGDVIETRYLYYSPGGALEQPVYLFKRNDMEPDECRLSQVTRYKPQPENHDVREAPASERPRPRE